MDHDEIEESAHAAKLTCMSLASWPCYFSTSAHAEGGIRLHSAVAVPGPLDLHEMRAAPSSEALTATFPAIAPAARMPSPTSTKSLQMKSARGSSKTTPGCSEKARLSHTSDFEPLCGILWYVPMSAGALAPILLGGMPFAA